jgi:hypothetical protein
MKDKNNYPLFEDIKNPFEKIRNLAAIMVNIYEDYSSGGVLSNKGVSVFFTYYKQTPKEIRGELITAFVKELSKREHIEVIKK